MKSYITPSKYVKEESEKEREDYLSKRPKVNRKQPLMISEDSLEPYEDKWTLFKQKLGNSD
jgi:hypothetical protein